MGKLNKSIFPQSMIAEVRLRYVPDYFMDHLTLWTADKFSGFSGESIQGLTKYLFARTTWQFFRKFTQKSRQTNKESEKELHLGSFLRIFHRIRVP